MVRYLVSHGANLAYVDHALRGALYWSLYNACGETACFLFEAGTWPRPWVWMEDAALPISVFADQGIFEIKRNEEDSSTLNLPIWPLDGALYTSR
jgi:hypothetical protein